MTTELRLTSLQDLEWLVSLVRAYHEFEDVHMTTEERAKSVRELVVLDVPGLPVKGVSR